MDLCPCGTTRPYAACCGRFIDEEALPETAEELMRSRFSAYARGRDDYIVATEPGADPEAVRQWINQVRFVALRVLSAQGGSDDEEGTVVFEADLDSHGRLHTHRETSRFVRREGRWLFVQGKQNPLRVETRVGRNDPCPCGSGKKFKKCCLA